MLKRGKKGQITVFLIIGIVILLVFGSMFFLKKETVQQKDMVNQDLVNLPNGDTVTFLIQNCLASISEEGLLKVGRQGGYYKSPLDYSIIFFSDLMPYYYADEKMMFLSVDDSQTELENYILENIPLCINNFTAFDKEGYKITAGKMDVKVRYEGQVIVELNYPVVISQGVSVLELNQFSHQINVNMPKFFSVSKQLVDSSLKKPGYVCLTCMENLAAQEYMKIESYPINDQSFFSNDVIWFRLEDKPAKQIAGSNFSFEFVMEYLSLEVEEPLQIESIDIFEASVGEPFTYLVRANKENVVFEDDADFFDISVDGEISFIPNSGQRGTHFVTLTAKDNLGKVDNELVVFKII